MFKYQKRQGDSPPPHRARLGRRGCFPFMLEGRMPMLPPAPVYTIENCKFASPLQWGLSVFWRQPIGSDTWFGDLSQRLESDGIRLLRHRFTKPSVSQFLISTIPFVSPKQIVQRVKGRLQHLLSGKPPRPLKRNYAIRSIGKATRENVEHYIERQLDYHPMADEKVQHRFAKYQITREDVDLAAGPLIMGCTGTTCTLSLFIKNGGWIYRTLSFNPS